MPATGGLPGRLPDWDWVQALVQPAAANVPYGEKEAEGGVRTMCGIKPAYAQRFLGRWVQCHSVYGTHRGILTRVLPNGIVLHRAVQLASAPAAPVDAEPAILSASSATGPGALAGRGSAAPPDIQPVQFYGGFFVPFGGLYGLWPWFGFGFVI
jgi:hypothetical protein